MTTRTPTTGCLALAAAALLLALPARADRLDQLERRAAELVEQLERELEAVRRERESLQAEREALGGRDAAAEPAPASETARRVDVLTEEVARIKDELVVPPDTVYESEHGMGPAASKIYRVKRGLSLGGYGEGFYSNTVSDTRGTSDTADALRFVLYTGYKFSDRILLNAEIEFEHATTGATVTGDGGEVSLEFAYLDFLGWDWLNARTGLVLVPLGFVNEMHEPVFFHGNNRPEVERRIIPTTWRELGVGAFGAIGDEIEYRTYLHTSLNADGFSSSGIRDGRQSGSKALAESLAWSGRIDYRPRWLEGLLVGGAAFVGETGQDQRFDEARVDGLLALWDLHAQYRYKGLELRALAAFGTIGDAATISREVGTTVGDRFQGHYAEIAYDVMPHLAPRLATQALLPFFRYENFDTTASAPSGLRRDRTKDTELYTLGLTYKPHPQVALKLDWRNFEVARGQRADDVNVGAGFIF